MNFNNFNLNIIFRSLILALTALGIAFLFNNRDWIFTLVFLGILFTIQIYLLIRYVGKINTDLANFLIHIKEQDTTLAFSKSVVDKSFKGLSKEFEKINTEIKTINNDKIKKQNLLNQLMNQVGTGIIVFDSNNKIKLSNKAIHNILGTSATDCNNLREKVSSVFENLNRLNIGEQSIETIQINNLTRRILISLSGIKEDNQDLKVYSFHDIDREITDYELQSWNGLIKVLSHEILNTVTPISTVVDTLKDCLLIEENAKKLNEINEKDILDSVKSVSLIENRINSLQGFIGKFRQFSELNTPEIEEVNISDLLENIIDVYKTNFSHIRFNISIMPDDLLIKMDKRLIELTINNIIKNAIEAGLDGEQTTIEIKAFKLENKNYIEFYDNGKSIELQVAKKVFLPFYTTKEQGSGIGLSLARQIMFSHNGNIEFSPGSKGTCVKLIFNEI
ncbi:MAG: hypothetical protein JEY96_02890 [Bacteroidales bacterium]|nr:hypothetical protein [Bacteroidales bacterium]